MGLKIIQQLHDWIYKRKHGEMRYKMKSGQIKSGDVMVERSNAYSDPMDKDPTVYIIHENDTENETLEYEVMIESVEEVTARGYEPHSEFGSFTSKYSYDRLSHRKWKHISMGWIRFSFSIGENRSMEHATLPRKIDFPQHE